MAMSSERRPFAGGWGPYFGAALPDCWIGEGGQSATGALLDHIIRLHGAGGEPSAARHGEIAERIMALRAEEGLDLAGRLHVLPDFHGNRSPLADPHALGVISGLTLDASFDSLCRLYWRTAVSIALGVRHILETLNESGFVIDTLHVTGGHTKNPLLMELYADAVGCTVIEPLADEAVLHRHRHGGRDRRRALSRPRQRLRRHAAARPRAQAECGGAGALRPGLPGVPGDAAAEAGAGRDGLV